MGLEEKTLSGLFLVGSRHGWANSHFAGTSMKLWKLLEESALPGEKLERGSNFLGGSKCSGSKTGKHRKDSKMVYIVVNVI